MKSIQALTKIKPSQLPAPPQAAVGIVKACKDPDVGAGRLAEIVKRDPRLTVEVLRTVNSAYFCLDRKVRSATQAVAVLGNRALRNIALCFAVRSATNTDSIEGLDIGAFWEDALRRGVVARILAERIGVDEEDAFTLGLLQEFGVLLMLHLQPEHAGTWELSRGMGPEERMVAELAAFGTNHAAVGALLVDAWGLPEEMGIAILNHHYGSPHGLKGDVAKLSHVAGLAEHLAVIFTADDKQRTLEEKVRMVENPPLCMTRQELGACLEKVAPEVEKIGTALGLSVKEQPRLEEMLVDANEQLVEANLTYQELTWKLQQTTKALELANARLERMAHYDCLTGLSNRRHFRSGLVQEILRHGRSGRPLSLFTFDIDNFKYINDNFGHPCGDMVLTAMARSLERALRATDLKARIGGDEFGVLLPETTDVMGRRSARRFKESLEALELTMGDQRVPVTASMGGVTWASALEDEQEAEEVAEALVRMADEELYASKRIGGDRVSWRMLHVGDCYHGAAVELRGA